MKYDIANNINDYHNEIGMGRLVILLDDVVIKIPKTRGNRDFDGIQQNIFEYNLYSKLQTDVLAKCISLKDNILIMERIESNPDRVMELMGLQTIYDLHSEIQKRLTPDLIQSLNKNNVNIKDFLSFNNWGYNTKLGKLQCLDYGLCNSTARMNMF